jgi:16S rRNA (guanine527-N7)-methyltransferase
LEKEKQYLKELKELFWENELSPESYQLERLAKYAELLVDKNQVVNLISRKNTNNAAEKHIFLSAYVKEFFPEKVKRFLDVGTGGGLPGIPIAILNPMMRGVLVDSTAKKIEAVNEFITKLRLSNVVGENIRVESEEFKKKYANKFDLIISRGTVPLIVLIRYALPLVKEKSYILAIKGGNLEEEFKKAELKYKAYIKKHTNFDLSYKPNNIRNQSGKKIVLLELSK